MAHARTGSRHRTCARWLLAALAATHLLSATAPAHAQPSEAELERARERFKEGVAFVEQERWAEAADIFQEVAAIKASPVVTYNLALAWSKLGKLLQAVELLRPLARDATAPAEVRQGASTLLADAEPRLGSVTVHAKGNTADVELWVDSREFTASWLGRPIEVNPGSVEVRAKRGGMQVAQKWVEVANGARNVEVTLDLGEDDRWGAAPAAAGAPVVPPPRETAESGYSDEDEAQPGDDAVEMDFAEDRDSSGSVFGKWWFWTAVVAVAAGGVTAAILLTADDTPADPVGGDIGDGVIKSAVTVPMGGM